MQTSDHLPSNNPSSLALSTLILFFASLFINVAGILPYYDMILILITGILFLWFFSAWIIFNKFEIVGSFIRKAIIPAFFIFTFLYFLFSIFQDLNSLVATFLVYFIPLALIILQIWNYESIYDLLDFRTLYFRTASSVTVGLLFTVIYFILQDFFSFYYLSFIISYAFLYSAPVIIFIGILYSFVNSKRRILSMPSSFITLRRTRYILLSLLDGLLIGIYQHSTGAYGVAVLTIIVLTFFYVIIEFLVAVYHSVEPVNEKYVVSSFKKFDRKEQISLIPNINSISKSIDEFEKYGRKESMIVNLTSYLSERGKTVQEVENAIKPLLSYKPPYSLILGLHGNRKNVEWELRKRTDIVNRIFDELKQV